MYCKDCEYFIKDFSKTILQGSCRNIKINYSHRIDFDDELVYRDNEGYNASVIVGGKFGCVHFTTRLIGG